MRIDSTHRPWMVFTVAAVALLGCTFVLQAKLSATQPGGGTVPGILYGVAGYGLMLYAALLGVRKRVPVWRVGRAQTWMRGHLWLGFLTLPLILFHCAFRWHGPLTSVLMWLLFFTVTSGVVGAAFQHFMPAFLTRSVPLETIYEEIPHIREQLCAEADQLANTISGAVEIEAEHEVILDLEIRQRFSDIYVKTIRPSLVSSKEGIPVKPEVLNAAFDSLRKMLPTAAQSTLAEIEDACAEAAQLQSQRRIYLWLHGWLLVHVPLSIVLIVLGAVHAVMALRY